MRSLCNRCYYVVCGMSFMLFNEYENLPGSWREMRRNLLYINGLCVERLSRMQAWVCEWDETMNTHLVSHIRRNYKSRNAHTNRITQPLSVHNVEHSRVDNFFDPSRPSIFVKWSHVRADGKWFSLNHF